MIPRYSDKGISAIWSDENKLALWQKVELAVISAKARLGAIATSDCARISCALEENPVDMQWWSEREKLTHHDLQAWVEARVRVIPGDLKPRFHEGMTSYDTEEPAFALMLQKSLELVLAATGKVISVLQILAVKYRHTPMMGVTHGQSAEVQTFGKRCLTWLADISLGLATLKLAQESIRFSKISGAIGNYGGISPEVEEVALVDLGLEPYYGATQIMPREIFAPLASALTQIVMTVSKIGVAIRLGARSPRPIYQEPFGTKQTGSSAMPHKQNTIRCEQLEGMGRVAIGLLTMLMQNINTWEERAIEQSSVERIAWPNLFHVAMRSLSVLHKVLEGLRVYPDNMLQTIVDTRGTWASGSAKEFLRANLAYLGISPEDAYRIVQLASFLAFAPSPSARKLRENPPGSLDNAGRALDDACHIIGGEQPSIWDIIVRYALVVTPELDIPEETIRRWKTALSQFFEDPDNMKRWYDVFSLPAHLEGENILFTELLGI